MSELTVAAPAEIPDTAEHKLQKSLMRIKRTAKLLGVVGAREGLSLLAGRVRDANAETEHTVKPTKLDRPFVLTAAHSDIAMLNEILGMGVYDLPPQADKVIDGNLIIDLGANIGVSAALFASRYPHSTVLAVEPHPRNFDLLEQNSASYGGRIVPIQKAMGLEEGMVGLSNPNVAKIGHHAVYEFDTITLNGGVAAEAMVPEELLSLCEERLWPGQGIGLLKINIEGAEKELLASRRLDPLLEMTKIAIIEAHERKVAGTESVVLAAASRNRLKPFDRRGPFYFFER